MKIVKVESTAEMKDQNVYYDLDGKFYALCKKCGKAVELDYHLTKHDLQHDDFKRDAFCDEECEKNWFFVDCPTLEAALLLGEEERAYKFLPLEVKEAFITKHYDEESAENDARVPAGSFTINDLVEVAREYAKLSASHDDYFKTMKMQEKTHISVDEEYVDISFTFTEGDFSTDIQVTFIVKDFEK